MALVSIAWISDVPRQRSWDWTPYHNDAIAINECAARLVLEGRDPYASLDMGALTFFALPARRLALVARRGRAA